MADSHDRDQPSRPTASYGVGDALFLAERAVRRWASYYRDIADLTREGSVEPRLWIGSVENLWRGLAEDYGDVLRRCRGEDDGTCHKEPTLAPTSPFRFLDVTEGAKLQKLALEVPAGSFAPASVTKISLSTDGMWRNGFRVLRPGTHLHFDPPAVEREARATTLHFHDLPDSLRAGMTLVGTIVAHPIAADGSEGTPTLVTVLQLRIA